MSDTLLVEDIGKVRRLTMNRPEKMNALNNELTQALFEEIWAADKAAHINAVILTGRGRAFCAGADMSEVADMAADTEAALTRGELTMRVHAAFVQVSVPIICAVNGFALGGGCGLATAGDLTIAAESAQLGYPETRRDGVAAVVMANLVRQIGRKAAYELVALGERLSAEAARGVGLINRVIPDDKLQETALAMAERIAGTARHAQRATKRLFHRVADMRLLDALEIGRDANMIMRNFNIRTSTNI